MLFFPPEKPPEATNEVGDHENDHNQPENLVSVHHDIETLKPVSPCRILIVALDDPFESTCVQDCHQL